MAIDDTYSRYVASLNATMYFRFNSLVVGSQVLTNEMPTGYNLTGYTTGSFSSALAADDIGTGSLLPSRSGVGTRYISNAKSRRFILGGNASNGTGYLPKMNPLCFSINAWLKPYSGASGNDRWFHVAANTSTDWYNGWYVPGVSLFSYNTSAYNGLAECSMRRKAFVQGAANITNPGNNELYRYMALTPDKYPLANETHMYTFVRSMDSSKIYKNGQLISSFTWNPAHYTVKPFMQGYALLFNGSGAGSTGYNLYSDYFHGEFCEFSVHHKTLTDTEVAELYFIGVNGRHSRGINGTVIDQYGNGLARLIRVHGQTTGLKHGETTSSVSGAFTVYVPDSVKERLFVVAFDDTSVAPDYNAVIQSDVVV